MEFLEISNVSVAYGNKQVLENFSHTFRPGVTCVVGANGVGKSTLLSVISTTAMPDEGEVCCCIEGKRQPFDIIRHGNFVPDKPDFYQFITIKEFLRLIKRVKGLTFDLHESPLFSDFKLEKHLYTPLHALSFGTRKKIFLLVALTAQAPVIIIDEPTNGLDDESLHVLVDYIQQNSEAGRIIVMTSHNADFIHHFDAEMIAL